MLLDLKFSIGTLGIGSGAFIAALYGMNLKNFMEEDHLGFVGISGFCAAVTTVAVVWAFRRLRKVQRLSMWGESGSLRRSRKNQAQLAGATGRGSWNDIDSPVGMAGHWERHEHLRHDHSPTGQHLSGGARGLAATVAGIKQEEKLKGWKDKHGLKVEKHGMMVDGALPPVPVGQ